MPTWEVGSSRRNPSQRQLVHHKSDIDLANRGDRSFMNRLSQVRTWKMAVHCATIFLWNGGGSKTILLSVFILQPELK
jgi:hypothetical protein